MNAVLSVSAAKARLPMAGSAKPAAAAVFTKLRRVIKPTFLSFCSARFDAYNSSAHQIFKAKNMPEQPRRARTRLAALSTRSAACTGRAGKPPHRHSTIRLTGGFGRLRRRSALHALDVPVHHEDFLVLHPLAFRDALLARLIGDRAGEDVVGAVLPAGDDLVGGGLHVGRHCRVEGRHDDRAFLEAPPDV